MLLKEIKIQSKRIFLVAIFIYNTVLHNFQNSVFIL